MSSQCTVLVVEDEPLIMMAACDMVENAGFMVREAANADIALQILEGDPAIAAIFTDIDMPGSMDGMALARQVQSRWPAIGIILTSGRRPLAPHEAPLGAIFLEKPYFQRDILDVLKIVIS